MDFTFRLVPLTLRILDAHGVRPDERARPVQELPDGAATAPVVTAPLATVQRFLERAEAGPARLGYSEPGSFDRAFRRWTGKTPTAWRTVTAG